MADEDATSGSSQAAASRRALLARVRPTSWPARLISAALITVLTLALLLPLLYAGAFSGARDGSRDRFYPAGVASDRILVVELNILAMERDDHARLIRALADGGADAILYDVVFDFEGDPQTDADLAAAIRDAGNVVLASATRLRRPADGLLLIDTEQPPIPLLAEAARAVGHASVWTDPDGVVRTIPIAADDGRRFVPSLSAATVAVAEGGDPTFVTTRPFGVQVGDLVHPSPEGAFGLMTISWAPGLKYRDVAAPAVSGDAVLAGEVPPEVFEGKVVMVGDAADNIAIDYHLMPVAKAGGGMPGVWAQANAVNTMLTAQYRSPVNEVQTVVAMVLLAFLAALAAVTVRLRWILPAVLVIEAAFFLRADLQMQNGQDTDIIFPSLALVFAAVAAVGLRYLTEVRERRRVADLFGHYIPPAVAKELVESGRLQAAAAGERLEISTWFADLRGFTATAATLAPTQVRELLDVYYAYTTEIILEHGGTVMQYVGDEVFAIFGAPVQHPDHTQRAVDAAIAVRDAVTEVNADLARRGLPPIQYGIGVNTGSVVAAHVGTYHKQYSVIGDTVNVGSRLCALAKAGHVTFPEEVRVKLERCPEIEAYGPVYMKGVERDVDVHLARRPDSAPVSHEETVKAGPKAGPAPS